MAVVFFDLAVGVAGHDTTAPVCCDLGADPDCVITEPDCMAGGTKQVPTGACSPTPGYRSNSTLEAFWQLLIGQVCAPIAPFKCVPIALPKSVTPSEAAATRMTSSALPGPRSRAGNCAWENAR